MYIPNVKIPRQMRFPGDFRLTLSKHDKAKIHPKLVANANQKIHELLAEYCLTGSMKKNPITAIVTKS